MQSLPVIEPLCRAGGHSCAACCHGGAMSRAELEKALERQTALFRSLIGEKAPTRLRACLVELLARGLTGLAWALLLLLPFVGRALRPWLRRRVACAFLGYLDGDRREVGCLLHPSRFGGDDLRPGAAFSLWRGFGCGEAKWRCLPAWRWQRGTPLARRAWLRQVEGVDWYDYGKAVTRRECSP